MLAPTSSFASFQPDENDGYDASTDLGRKMNSFEEFLRCPCCREFLDNPMSLNCGHIYCSECIRKHLDSVINTMQTSSRCPCCPQPAESSHLKPARTVSQLLESYLQVRNDLIVNVEGGITVQESSYEGDNDNDFIIQKNEIVRSKGKGRLSSSSSSSSSSSKVSHMTHKLFHGLSLAKAKQLVQDLSLKSQVKIKLDGNKDALARRYRDFVNLNNSQLHKENPMSIEKMCQEINKREIAREKEAVKSKQQKNGKKIEAMKNGISNDGFLELTKKIKQQKKFNDENKNIRRLPQDMEHSSWAGYRIVYSKLAQRPFYYHIQTGIGSWEMPIILTEISHSSPSSSSPSSPGLNVQSKETPRKDSSSNKRTPSTSNQKMTRSSSRKRKQSQSLSQDSLQNDSQSIHNDGGDDHIIQETVLSLSATSDIENISNDQKEEEAVETKSGSGNDPSDEIDENPQPVITSTSIQFSADCGNLAWNCNVCTYLNESSVRVCEMCGSEGLPRKSSRRSSQGTTTGATQTSQTSPPKKNAFDNMVFASISAGSKGSNKGGQSTSSQIGQGGKRSSGGRRNS